MKKMGFRVVLIVGMLAVAAPLYAQTFHSSAERAFAGFGNAVALGAGDVLVAEPLSSAASGVVFVYRRSSDGTWVEAQQLRASDAAPGDRFGSALAADGNTLLVGAPTSGPNGASYVFERDDSGEWTEVARLVAGAGDEGGGVGRAVALRGDFAFVGSVAHNEGAGAVWVFQRSGSSWTERAVLAGSDVGNGERFGAAIAADGNRVLVGAPRHNRRQGAVYAFRHDPAAGTWTEEAKLVPDGLTNNNQFGAALLLTGNHALASAPLAGGFVGAVFAYELDAEAGEWSEHGKLVAFDGARRFQFGAALAHSGSEIWIGAPGAAGREGRVYAFRHDEAGGLASATKIGSALDASDRFASAVAVGGDVGVVGVRGDDYGEGTAMIFERDPAGMWNMAAKVFSEPTGLDPIVGGQVDCTEGAARQFDCEQVDMVAFLPVRAIGGARGVRVNDVWGWTDPATGREYALVGRLDGTSFIDVSDPYTPVYLGNLPRTDGSPGSTWRDIKVYDNHAFIVADGAGEHGMQVFDLTQLRDVRDPPVLFEETARYNRIHSTHNIVINEESGFAFAVGNSAGGETCGGGLHMIDIREPAQPTFAGCFADPETGRRRTGYTHDAQCVTYHGPDNEHRGKEICFGANETALSIADVTDKDQPVAMASASYPNVGYAHQGWLTEDQRYFYLGDELDEAAGNAERTRTLIWDVTDLDDPVLVKEHYGTQASIDHNLYIRGNLMYQSNYNSGLRILDISDQVNPVEIGYFDTVPYGENTASFGGSWSNYPFFASGVIIVTSGGEGVFVLKRKQLVP